MKRVLRIILRSVLVLLVLLVAAAASLYLPPVQRWAVDRLTAYVEKETGMEVSIGSVHLAFPLDLELGRLHVADGETDVLDVESALVDLDLSRVFSQHIGVEAIELRGGSIRTTGWIESLRMEGSLGSLLVRADDIDLKGRRAGVTEAVLDGCMLDLTLRETPEDTTESEPVDWQIDVGKVRIAQSIIRLTPALPKGEEGDSLSPSLEEERGGLYAAVREASLDAGDISLRDGAYRLGSLKLAADSLAYDGHAIRGLDIELDKFSLDTAHLSVARLDLRTPHSSLGGSASLDWKGVAPLNGRLDGALQASLGSEDVLMIAASSMPKDLAKCYPRQPLNIELRATGNVDSLSLQACSVAMPSVVDARATGFLLNLTDSARLGADVHLDVTTMDLSALNRYLGLSDVRFPRMILHADTRLREASKLYADALLTELGQGGRVHLVGDLDTKAMAYRAKTRITNLQLHDFLPKDSLYLLTASAQVSGRGTDLLRSDTRLLALLDVDHLGYASWNLDSIHADARLERGNASLELDSRNDLLGLQGCVDALISERKVKDAAFNMDLNHVDLYALGVARKPLSASMVMHLDGASDFRQTHSLKARIEAMELITADSILHPLDLTLDAGLTPELISMKASAGDLALSVTSDQGLDSLLAHFDNFMQEARQQVDSLNIRQDTLRTLLPHLRMEVECGQKNPIAGILRHATGYTFRDLSLSLHSSPDEGLKGQGHMNALNTGGILLDTITWRIRQEQDNLSLNARVANGPKNRMVTFQSQLRAALTPTGAQAGLLFYDAKGEKSVDFGLALDLLADGVKAHFTPLNPTIAYRRFTLNEDNFVSLAGNGHLEALVDLLADDGTGIKLYTTPNEEALQDISLSVNRFNVGELTHVIPFMPDITGFLHGDLHYMQADSTSTVSADMVVQDMAYNSVRLGNIGVSGAYFPNADGSHYADGIITQDGREILLASGKYSEKKDRGTMDGEASLQGVPFAFLNAFMPDGPLAMSGYAWGDMEVSGSADSPILSGELRTDSLRIDADSYNVNLQFPDHTITIDKSHVKLGKIEAYAAGKTPLVLDGDIDFSDLKRVQLDLNVRAQNYQLINAPKRQGALAYGKVFVDVGGRLWGTLSDLKMRGRLGVLGSTDVTCVLTDTPITVDDQLSDIVTFCDFTDTVQAEPIQTERQSIDIQMNVSIAEGAQVHCFLSSSGNDYIDLQGGGDLTLTYDMQNDMQLWGRYTIQKGTMRYSIMAIPLNDFHIEQGNYVEFQGNMNNPRLSISASERVRSSVTENNTPRNVAFDVGLKLSRTLEDMGLEFTLEAPEDMTVQNQLTAMTQEERGRVAVTMLVTGMYVTDDAETNGGYNYANTLNAYLQSAINEVAGKALSTVDVNFGIAEGTSEAGTATTDYSFSFAKRFWGNRISVVVGGRVSTGSDAVNTGQTIIDNISIEYRLDKSASRYVHVFYDRNYESLLEGQITKMGGGIVLRKKAERLRELFIFRKPKDEMPRPEPTKQEQQDENKR